MTNKEKLSKAYEYIEKANKLIDEVAHADSDGSLDEDNPVADYINIINDRATKHNLIYFISDNGEVADYLASVFNDDYYNPYYQFPTQSYAEGAARMYKMICMQLAFKWCYDRDYMPDWNNSDENKYAVYFNYVYNKYYIVAEQSSCDVSTVYFSTYEIAQKCAEWLNSMKEENKI